MGQRFVNMVNGRLGASNAAALRSADMTNESHTVGSAVGQHFAYIIRRRDIAVSVPEPHFASTTYRRELVECAMAQPFANMTGGSNTARNVVAQRSANTTD